MDIPFFFRVLFENYRLFLTFCYKAVHLRQIDKLFASDELHTTYKLLPWNTLFAVGSVIPMFPNSHLRLLQRHSTQSKDKYVKPLLHFTFFC